MQCSDNVPMDKTGWGMGPLAVTLCVLPVVPTLASRRAVRMDYRYDFCRKR